MAKNEGMSLNPEDFTEGGGLIDDVNVTWNKVRFEMFCGIGFDVFYSSVWRLWFVMYVMPGRYC